MAPWPLTILIDSQSADLSILHFLPRNMVPPSCFHMPEPQLMYSPWHHTSPKCRAKVLKISLLYCKNGFTSDSRRTKGNYVLQKLSKHVENIPKPCFWWMDGGSHFWNKNHCQQPQNTIYTVYTRKAGWYTSGHPKRNSTITDRVIFAPLRMCVWAAPSKKHLDWAGHEMPNRSITVVL